MPRMTLCLTNLRVESFATGAAVPREVAIPTTRTQEPGCTSPTLCNPLMC